ncbi:uncharacterized protein RAG0_00932 [Rhynchosporium agropyri]|uniref:Uncharacterized protein n=1 Tax=Rhynchosporium agropyri TaxID=914238 RepID=A0A1E1JUM7_9HELO|nr:uncharacterized protein RAG0_00932 [Rhynchosporium agropyri]
MAMNDLTSKPPQWCSALGAVCDHSMEYPSSQNRCKLIFGNLQIPDFGDCENRQKSMRNSNPMPGDTKKKKKKFFRILYFSRI